MNNKLIITAMLTLITMTGWAQDVNTCQPIAERILTAAQNHKPDGIDELLAPEFHFNNIKQPLAAKVLKQIIAQMPPMTSWELSRTEQDSTRLTLHYIITQPDNTTSEATILFTADNLVIEDNLLPGKISLQKGNPTAKIKPNIKMVRVPINRYDGLPIVTVTIDGQQYTTSTVKDIAHKTRRNIKQTAKQSIITMPGRHKVEVKRNGTTVYSKEVMLSTGETKIIEL